VALGAAPGDVVARAAAHADPEVVKEAVLAAARVAGPDGERVIREAAASLRWDVRQAAARALAERGDRALAPDAARAAATDPDPLVARAFADAARILGAG
jgi:HEAT repeat protein